MRWSEHQQALLAEMGLRVWQPQPVALPMAGHAHSPVHAAPHVATHVPAHIAAHGVPAAARATPSATPIPTPAARVPVAAPAPAVVPAKVVTRAAVAPAPARSTPAVVSSPEAQAREAAIARMSWPELRQAVASCQACSLCASRTQTVFGVGNEQAELMIVGEAPGEQEDLQGEPFVGPAGQLLDNMLAAVNLSRQAPQPPQPASAQVFIANTLKCRPPRNRNPEPAEMAMCLPFLRRQIELVRPRLLLASGRYAVDALLGKSDAIGRLRGQIHHYQGTPVVVTYHPAYLLRQLPEKAKAWEDLCLALDTLAGTLP